MKKTLVLGASPNTERYSNRAVKLLRHFQHTVVAIGGRPNKIDDVEIIKGTPALDDIDTVTLYLGIERQVAYYEYIISLKPKRLIFNPGTENHKLKKMAQSHNIETIEKCTLIMLNRGDY